MRWREGVSERERKGRAEREDERESGIWTV
jgi:hypothetical protein